ncbi:Ribosome small subunit biogenesis RbfA-release protein RsgA [uncultured Gammaproteobacteria bacterium]|uniref:ribosome small subunit-dependent GTPase A n=1 Tax=Bathymodiolus heckerae thiotrophic gill symbiont TaxID=1052212 RepID=UPI0010AFCE3D|nr:ribosome small subunit-dependent GTPase A [Bathymodiolus heckerae thiotrophic gill symbiont]CAC9440565.1 Ribosome small subunit biogenesis RbfA-release protein RsgA [uncultured Gammaproteobacteria bacterium]SMN13857.1 Ribosome small subunit-stimulated GTPase EngC [Bathymodiolus heckerae thiotrophic gill symbiont]SMN15796.1 Ribosome small subunit-stimulated GTPase EngC [uncultured Candidatus Thioglobus sp.]
MSLTRRQQWRIEKIQAERIARVDKASSHSENLLDDTTQAQTGLVITRYGQRLLIENSSGDLIQCTARRNIESCVAGDQVVFQALGNDGVITALHKRNNALERSHKLIAANIDELWLVVAIEPHYQFDLIDRYLIMAQNTNLAINIIVNKIELSDKIEQVKKDFAMYEDIGYPVHYLSVKAQIGIDTLTTQLDDKAHIFLGQSGVGKSSLINQLIPDLNLRVNEISSKSKLGKHTTTTTTLYHIPTGGDLIDSPGVREFQLDTLNAKEILEGFREFKPFVGQCKFRNCAHINEPNCTIKNALEAGNIHPKRYQSYLNLIK